KNLERDEMTSSMQEIMEGKASPARIGAFLALLKIKKETSDEITAAALVMRDKALKIDAGEGLMDTCSTGGTGLNHFNISTTVAFVLAGQGIKVAKHGNRASSGKCGSADVLEELGAKLDIEPAAAAGQIKSVGIGFLYAPAYHKAMKYAAPVRRELGFKTIFNVLGPLTNPASASCQQLGVYSPELVEPLGKVLKKLGTGRSLVVHGAGGLDEVSLAGPTKAAEVKAGLPLSLYELTPEDFGLKKREISTIKGGGGAEVNARRMKSVLAGEKGPLRDYVLANSATSFMIYGTVSGLKDGVKLAAESIDSGKAKQKLKEFIEYTKEER
ncbi:MAG: anthranilate phosphoribosyltransferase, partial [Elusimicrobiota bacterium]|nr:anthranilate phosphoribosyltransferase [Elusimicrobiota bacterium]